MSGISNFLNKLDELSARLFPVRQLYFRTNGVVRFVSISRPVQIVASIFVLGLMSWSALTSYTYITRAEILAAKDLELADAEKNYSDTNHQFDQLKNEIEKTAVALEQRQIYLQQLLDTDKSLAAKITETEKKPANMMVEMSDVGVTDNDQGKTEGLSSPASKFPPNKLAKNPEISFIYSQHEKQMSGIKSDLARIEQLQQQLAERMVARISTKIAFVENILESSGIKSVKLMQLAENRPSLSMAMGGPFILYAENNDVDLTTKEPFAKLYAYYNRLIDLESAVQHIPIGKPAKKYYLSSTFGIRKDPFKKTWARHNGLDMAGWWKTPIYATANGVVVKAGVNGAYGNFIEIDHGNGFRSRYGHLSKLKVKKGDLVTLEQEIGLMGSTGRSTSPHLHYEIWFNGKPINPLKIFKASNNVLKIQRQEYDS